MSNYALPTIMKHSIQFTGKQRKDSTEICTSWSNKPYLKVINNLSHQRNLKLPHKKAIQNGKNDDFMTVVAQATEHLQ